MPWMARLSAASDASCSASLSVGCAWIVRWMSSADAENSIASTASAISSPATGPDDVHAEHVVVLLIGDELHEADRLLHALRAAVGGEAERADLVRPAGRFDLFLGLADPGDLGRRVDDGRDRLVVHLGDVARDQLGDHDAFFHALVREHRAADDVADGPDVRHRRAALLVDLDEAALVERHLHVGREQPGRHGPAADGDDERVDVELLRRAAHLVAHLDGVALRRPRR